LRVGIPERGDEAGRDLEVGRHTHFRNGNHGAGNEIVADFPALQHLRQCVAHLLADAELALGKAARAFWIWRTCHGYILDKQPPIGIQPRRTVRQHDYKLEGVIIRYLPQSSRESDTLDRIMKSRAALRQ